jgi:hypothetical protein
MKKLIAVSLIFFSVYNLYAQDTIPNITVTGKVIGDNTIVFNRVMVINKGSGNGTYVGIDGSFTISIKKQDTLMFAYTGYRTSKICFKDSIPKKEYLLAVKLDKLSYQLKEIAIYPIKKLSDVQKEIEQMDARKKRIRQLEGADALQSPITALYERFSRMEQSKRKVAELENEDMKREVLKDLFRIYIKYDIFDLSDEQFDDFITFCDMPDRYIMNATQYELVEGIKARYNKFVELNDYVRHKK